VRDFLVHLSAGFFHLCSPHSTGCTREKEISTLVTQKVTYSPLYHSVKFKREKEIVFLDFRQHRSKYEE
jgi:hypothetical protein